MGPLFLTCASFFSVFLPTNAITIAFPQPLFTARNSSFTWTRTQDDPLNFNLRKHKLDDLAGVSDFSLPTDVRVNGASNGSGKIYFPRSGLIQVTAFDSQDEEYAHGSIMIFTDLDQSFRLQNPLFATNVWVSLNPTPVGGNYSMNSTDATMLPIQTNNPSESSNKSLNSGQLAGILIGVILAMILTTTGGITFWRRRKNRQTESGIPMTQTGSEFVIPYPHTTSALNAPSRKKQELTDRIRDLDMPETRGAERERRIVRLEDSGWRPLPPHLDAGDSSIVLMPPSYDAAV
ncbi:hypothetical protein VNI00_016688 [Paramarasmius palmivorus]|uniref:Uncharacterized protein n=1 Tax=Paramarasmius palmivorus TaxID=297713 RepID=A0AAW0BCB7_9AGAR